MDQFAAGIIIVHFHGPAGLRGRPRRLTSKAHLADEVAEAATLAAALPAAGTSAQPALPAEGKRDLSALQGNPSALQVNPSAPQGTAAKGLHQAAAALAASADKASSKQKQAEEKAAQGKAQLEGVAKLANELQPTGSTLSTMQVHTKVQHIHPELKLRIYEICTHHSCCWFCTYYDGVSSLSLSAAKLLLAGIFVCDCTLRLAQCKATLHQAMKGSAQGCHHRHAMGNKVLGTTPICGNKVLGTSPICAYVAHVLYHRIVRLHTTCILCKHMQAAAVITVGSAGCAHAGVTVC